MRRAKIKRAERPKPGAAHPAVAGTDLLLSIVEIHNRPGNGNVIKMDSGSRAQQELDKIEEQIARLQALEGQSDETRRHIQQLHDRLEDLRTELSPRVDAWERTNLARHPQRPYTLDYVERIFTDWSEIHGDRGFRDDPAIVCGMATFHGEQVVVIGQQKARDAKQRVYRNFGMPHPEGYRKAIRVMKIAEKFGRPVFTFVDTDGAYPGLHAEERGQGEAIARNLLEMSRLASADHCDGDWSWRQWRSFGDCCGRSCIDDGKFRLLGYLTGGLRVHHVARSQQENARGGGHEDYCQRYGRVGLHRRNRAGASRRRPHGSCGGRGNAGRRAAKAIG